MRKLILGCALTLVAEIAQADAYVSTYMTSECGFRGYMAFQINGNKALGVDAIKGVFYQWIKAVATNPEAKDSVMYPAFKSWYDHTTKEQMDKWIETVVAYDDPITASNKERLACEKQAAGEE